MYKIIYYKDRLIRVGIAITLFSSITRTSLILAPAESFRAIIDMEESQIQLNMMGKPAQDCEVGVSSESTATDFQPKTLKWWAKIFLYTFLILAGQAAATLLGRLYYDKGGNSTWMSTLVQVAGFPVLLPFYCFLPTPTPRKDVDQPDNKPSALKLGAVYTSLGLLIAFDCMLYSIGLLYLPVSTYALICASQLAFNALFAFLLKAQKFTPYIFNSLVVLTISSTLLVFQNESSSSTNGVTKAKYILGFVCTVGASALYGLILPLTQLAFQKVVKRDDFKAILDMLVYEYIVATFATIIGLFASGEWKTLKGEMEEYKLGKVSYVMTLTWIALAWQIFSIGSLKLITEISSLFSNVISTLGLPVVPVLAVFLFHDKMDGIKAIAMVLAIWGFISYAYQCYLDNQKSKANQGKATV